jgi:hypothetical protein
MLSVFVLNSVLHSSFKLTIPDANVCDAPNSQSPQSFDEHLFISYPVSSPELPTTIGKVVIPAFSAVQVANAPPSNQDVTAALYAATLVPLGSSAAIAQNNPAKIQHVAPDKTEHQMLRKKQQPFPSPVSVSTFRSKGPQHGDRCNGTLQAAKSLSQSPCG